MKVCIDAKILFENGFSSDYYHYLLDAFRKFEKENSQVEFCFLAGKVPGNGHGYPKKQQVLAGKSLPGLTGWKIWNRLQVPSLVKKTGAEFLIKPDGISCPKSIVPQIVWLPGNKSDFNNRKFSTWSLHQLATTWKESSLMLTNSEIAAQSIRKKFGMEEKLLVFPPRPRISESILSSAEKEMIRNDFANGKEFFLLKNSSASDVDLKPILQGFSQFKKMQRTNMQFVITGFSVAGLKMAEKLLENFRFRQDVHVFPEKSIPLWEPILKAAYALLLPDPDSFTLVRACSSQVPVIRIANSKEQAIPTEMAMIGDSESLGQMLMKIYKNETFRNELIREGIKKAAINLELADTKTLWPKILNILNEFSS